MAIKRTSDVSATFSMASLTDIIFLLLIFFMLTSTFVAPNALKLLLPKATGQTLATQTVEVSVTEDLRYFVDNQQVGFEQLESAIANGLRGSEKDAIVLSADSRIDYGEFVRVLKVCNKLNSRVVIKTTPE